MMKRMMFMMVLIVTSNTSFNFSNLPTTKKNFIIFSFMSILKSTSFIIAFLIAFFFFFFFFFLSCMSRPRKEKM